MAVRAMLAFAVDWLDSPNARQLGMRSSAASIMRHSLLELRKAKLGRWNVGLQKGLTQYVKDMYDNERDEMEKEALVDLELGKLDVVNDMNRQIYAMEFLEQKQIDQDADKEAFDMGVIPEDDDYGDDMDGDEGFY